MRIFSASSCKLVAALFALIAELALDRLQLLVEIIFALRLLHLPLHAAADLLLDLQHAELALHEGEDHLEPARRIELAKQRLLVGNLDRQVRSDRVGERRRILDLAELDAGFGRQPLVELRIIFELVDDRAHQRLSFGPVSGPPRRPPRSSAAVKPSRGNQIDEPGTLHAFDKHANGAVRQLQELHCSRDDAEIVERVAIGIVLAGIELGDEEQFLVRGHCGLERRDRFLATDEQRNDAVRENDDVAKRKNGEKTSHGRVYGRTALKRATNTGNIRRNRSL